MSAFGPAATVPCPGCAGGYYVIGGFEDKRPIPCELCDQTGRVPAGSDTQTSQEAAA